MKENDLAPNLGSTEAEKPHRPENFRTLTSAGELLKTSIRLFWVESVNWYFKKPFR